MNTNDNVKYGGSIFSVDKISLGIETKFINKENIEFWKTNQLINIMTFGETSKINIHAEFEPNTKHLGRKCFNAILLLINNNVFNTPFVFSFYQSIKNNSPSIFCLDFMTIYVIGMHFNIMEWEWAFDFYDLPIFSFMEINNKNEKSFKRYKDTNYSRDGKQILREKEINGKKVELSKGRQQSLVCHYNRGKKIKSTRHIERVEIRQQGKHKRDLSIDLLNGTKEEAIIKSLPILKKNVNNVLDKETYVINKYWEMNAILYFLEIFR